MGIRMAVVTIRIGGVETIRTGRTRLELGCGDESNGACGGWDGTGGVRVGEWKSNDAAGMR